MKSPSKSCTSIVNESESAQKAGESSEQSAQPEDQPQQAPAKRPRNLLRSPPHSGRPSVTFSLVLEQEMGDSTEGELANGKQKLGEQPVEWSVQCCSPMSSCGTGDAEEQEPRVQLLGCCVSVPLMECARFVGWLATIPIILSLLLLPLAPASIVELVPELALLALQLVCVLALFFGLQHRLANYLRPFLLFGLLWNLLLLLLLLFSLIELLVARERFCALIWRTVQEWVHGVELVQPKRPQMEGQLDEAVNFVAQLYEVDQAIAGAENSKFAPPENALLALWLTLALMFLLALAILLDGWLLNIVLLAYFHLKTCANRKRQGIGGEWHALGKTSISGTEAQQARQPLLSPKRQQKFATRSESCGSSGRNSPNGSSSQLRRPSSRGGIDNGGYQHSQHDFEEAQKQFGGNGSEGNGGGVECCSLQQGKSDKL